MRNISYDIEPDLGVEEFVDILQRSTLAERRPMGDIEVLTGMLTQTSLIVTAREEEELVGISRALTDYSFCTYLADLAVDVEFQGRGIGRELIRRTHEAAGVRTTLILLAAPTAESFYPHVGMTKHDSCWVIPKSKPV